MLDIPEKINVLRELSDGVDQYIASGIYLGNSPEMDAEADLVIYQDCLLIVIKELRELGILFMMDDSELITDGYQADALIEIRRMFDRHNLRERLVANRNVIPALESILEAEFDEDEYYSNVIDHLRVAWPNLNKTFETMDRLRSIVTSNILFKRHLLAVIDVSVPKATLAEDSEIRKAYLKKILAGRKFYEYIVRYLIDNKRIFPPVGYDKEDEQACIASLEHSINLYDMDKLTGSNLSELIWAVMTDPNTLHPDMVKVQDQIIYRHKSNATHHIEYYIARRQKPTLSQMYELACHTFEPHLTLDATLAAMREELDELKDAQYLPVQKGDAPEYIFDNEARKENISNERHFFDQLYTSFAAFIEEHEDDFHKLVASVL